MIGPSVPVAHPYGTGKNRPTRPPSEGFLSCSDRQSLTYPADQVPRASSVSDLAARVIDIALGMIALPSPETPMPTDPIEDRDPMGPDWPALGADLQ